MNGDKFFVVLQGRGENDAQYTLSVLGHGGVNTFPPYAGTCGECGVDLHSNVQDCKCPNCGNKNHTLTLRDSYSSWSSRTRGDSISTRCDFINRAAKHNI